MGVLVYGARLFVLFPLPSHFCVTAAGVAFNATHMEDEARVVLRGNMTVGEMIDAGKQPHVVKAAWCSAPGVDFWTALPDAVTGAVSRVTDAASHAFPWGPNADRTPACVTFIGPVSAGADVAVPERYKIVQVNSVRSVMILVDSTDRGSTLEVRQCREQRWLHSLTKLASQPGRPRRICLCGGA